MGTPSKEERPITGCEGGERLVVTAYAGEQQRPQAVKAGVLDRLNPLS